MILPKKYPLIRRKTMIAHPTVSLLSHNFSREDLFLVVYCVVDDWLQRTYASSNLPRKRRGPRAEEFSDSEVLTIILVGELCQCKRERAWLRQVRASYAKLFPHLPEDSRFNRRAQLVREALRGLREALLSWAGCDVEPVRLVDSFPMSLCACYRIRQSSQPISGSGFAYNSSKETFYFGLHPGLILTESGFIVDIVLAPAYMSDVGWLEAYLDECIEWDRDLSGQEWVLDKGFVSQKLKARAKSLLNVLLLARQRDYGKTPPSFWQKLIDQVRKPIEGVISVLTECFGIENIRVRSDIGIYRRTQAKATAFTLGRYFNEVLNLAPMNIARYAV
jgi:hypothetical protein